MQSVAVTMLSVLTALVPIAAIVLLLQLSTWRQRVRLAEISQQIAVTDAIHAVLGAVVSPVVRKSLWRGWRLTIPVPLERPETVMQIVETAYSAFDAAERARPGRFEIVLTQQEGRRPRPSYALAGTARGESVSWT